MSGDASRQGGSPAAQDELGRELARWAAAGEVQVPDLDALRSSLDAALAEERGLGAFLRSRTTPLRLVVAGVLLLAAMGAVWLLAARVDQELYPMWRLLLGLGFMLVAFFASVGLALWPLSRPAPRPRLVSTVLALAPVLLAGLYLMPAAHADHPASLQQPGTAALLVRASPCFGVGVLIALLSVWGLRRLDRGGTRVALLLATASGVAANILLLLHCPMTAPAHMLLGHLGVMLVFVAGTWLAQRGPPAAA
ncbi:MAG TPA: hypothetical protein VFZ61_22080 [Polyangiales bacterium]